VRGYILVKFTAIDFETANYNRHSACSVGIVQVENGRILRKDLHLIRPPESWFKFTHIHGLTWADVAEAPTFRQLWPEIRPVFTDVDFLVAHNASFDRSVLHKTCEYYGIRPPGTDFKCTVRLSRSVLGIFPTKLPNVCNALGIPMEKHHEALSDALACANIMLRILERYGKP